MDDKSFTIRVPRRWVRLGMIVTVMALIVAPLTAIASHSFTDVSNTNTFHADIAWMKDAEVTKGCNPPANTLYCPNDNVSRGQMAAFMRRFAKYIGAEDGAADLLTRARTVRTADEADTAMVILPGYTEVSTVDLVAPSDGAIVVQYSLSANRSAADTAFRVGLSTGSNCSAVNGNTHVYGALDAASQWDTASGSATFVVSAGTHSYTLCGHGNAAVANIDASSLTAMFLNEGSAGMATSGGASDGGGSDFGG